MPLVPFPMKLPALLARLREAPLVASIQASPGPLDHEDTLLRLARASLQEGVGVVRLEGVKTIRKLMPVMGVPVIGLLKRTYPDSDVYITPTAQDVDAILDLGCSVVALDGTLRPRPNGGTLESLIARIHRRKTLAMADCDSLESAMAAVAAGADLVGTTLGGYTASRATTDGPDLELLREIIRGVGAPVIAEGRYSQRWEIDAALRMGAAAVTVGGALNDPVKQTRALWPSFTPYKPTDNPPASIGAVDIGGTWLRFARFTEDWQMVDVVREPYPKTRVERLNWIKARVEESGVRAVGVSTGGIVDPRTGEVWRAKDHLMPDHAGIVFDEENLGVPTFAFGDGHASAWGSANLPQYAGRRVATLALGTGVGCGFVQRGRIWSGARGEYPRVNDLPTAGGETYEALLGGLHLTKTPTDEQKANALKALEGAVGTLRDLYFPDDVVVCGSVGLSDWLAPGLARLGVAASPFGADAGLYGAAALALFPGWKKTSFRRLGL